MLVKCNNCKFNIFDVDLEHNPYCPSCGEDLSNSNKSSKRFLQTILSASPTKRKNLIAVHAVSLIMPAFIGTIASIIAVLIGSFYTADVLKLVLIFIFVLFAVGLAVREFEKENSLNISVNWQNEIGKSNGIKQIRQKISGNKFFKKPKSQISAPENIAKWSLLGKSETAQRRIEELIERKKNINSISGKIRKSNNRKTNDINVKLDEANEIINTHIGRYRLQKQKIQLVMVQNNILPFLDNLSELTEDEAKKALKDCEQANQNLRDIKRGNNHIFEFIPKENEQIKDFENQINETKITIKNIEESILHRKAMLAIQGIKSIEDTFDTSDFGDLAHRLETFGARSSLVDFNESFDELELEYKRLRMENEASQKLLGQ